MSVIINNLKLHMNLRHIFNTILLRNKIQGPYHRHNIIVQGHPSYTIFIVAVYQLQL